MTTWTPATSQAETWMTEAVPKHVFSPSVFSHAISSGKRVFSMSQGGAETWDTKIIQAETWVAE